MTPVEFRERLAIARRDAGDEDVVRGMRIIHTCIQPRGGKSSLRGEISWRRSSRSL
jgi:hypothetical protein